MDIKERDLHPLAVGAFNKDAPLHLDERLSQQTRNFFFGMRSNGYLSQDGNWIFAPATVAKLAEGFKGQKVSFFGPDPNLNDDFFSVSDIGQIGVTMDVFEQEVVTDVIGKYRGIDEDQAARIAFLLGGIVRHSLSREDFDLGNKTRFVARMAKLGEAKSGDAIASAITMYVLSGGSLEDDRSFIGHTYNMGEAIAEDPIIVRDTRDLGLSQVARLRHFLDTIHTKEHREFPDIEEQKVAFDGFPTVGAEFHFSRDAAQKYPNFWKRLALLNMSQYQKESYVQLSRNDRGVIEVRMNPSIYPVAIADWKHMVNVLPELRNAFFTVTINRKEKDFNWVPDQELLDKLRALGMLTYAALFDNKPRQENSEEIDFGKVYLGQTVRVQDGKCSLTGNWGGSKGDFGQMGIYAGFGDSFPYLTHCLSMALVKPDFLEDVFKKDFTSSMRTLRGALALPVEGRRSFFREMQRRIEADGRLSSASLAGQRIVELLNP